MGVCAQKTNDLQNIICTSQIKDQKFQNGVGYQLELEAGEYLVYSYLDDQRAYYTEFVTCGLQYSCSSHAKIPVIVTAGSVQDDILPHDWYDTSPTSTPVPTMFKINPKTEINIAP